MPTPFVADAADEAVRSNSILNERKATDIIEETALEVDIRAWSYSTYRSGPSRGP